MNNVTITTKKWIRMDYRYINCLSNNNDYETHGAESIEG